MFHPLNPTPSRTSAKDAISGIIIAMVVCYVLYNIPDFLRGDFSLDLQAVRFLLFIGLLVMGFAWWEEYRK